MPPRAPNGQRCPARQVAAAREAAADILEDARAQRLRADAESRAIVDRAHDAEMDAMRKELAAAAQVPP
jgi:hypothetical protein